MGSHNNQRILINTLRPQHCKETLEFNEMYSTVRTEPMVGGQDASLCVRRLTSHDDDVWCIAPCQVTTLTQIRIFAYSYRESPNTERQVDIFRGFIWVFLKVP